MVLPHPTLPQALGSEEVPGRLGIDLPKPVSSSIKWVEESLLDRVVMGI